MNKYFAVICLFVLTGWSVQANAVAYTITDLGSFRGESINDSGQIAGMVMLDGVRRAAVRRACPGGSGKLPVTRLYSMPPSQNCQCLL